MVATVVARPRWWIVVPLCTLMSVVVFEQYLATQEQVIQLICEEQQLVRNVTCDSKDISSMASDWIRWVQGCGSIAVVGLAGAASDHFGRRKVLITAIVGYIFLSGPCLLVEYMPAARAQWRPLIVTGFGIGGLLGGMSMILLSVFAYVADCVTETGRSSAFTIIEAAIGLGGVIGDLGGGYCMDLLGPRAVFWTLFSITIFLLGYGVLLLPESLPVERRAPRMDWRMANCFFSLSAFFDPELVRPRRHVLWLAAAFLCAYFTVQGVDGVLTPFLSASPFSWSDSRIGIFNCIGLTARVTAGIVFAPLFEKYVHHEHGELWLIRISLLLYGASICMLGLGTSFNDLSIYSFVSGFMSALCFGYMRGLFSKSVSASRQGRMLGGVTFIVSAAQSLSPLLFNSIYSATSSSIPGMAFFMLGLSSLIACLLTLKVLPLNKSPEAALLLDKSSSSTINDAP